MPQSWQQVTNRLAKAFDGIYAEIDSLAAAVGVTPEPRKESEDTEYEQIAARVERITRDLSKINNALAEQMAPEADEDSDPESPEANTLAVDTTDPPGPTTRRKATRQASAPAEAPSTSIGSAED